MTRIGIVVTRLFAFTCLFFAALLLITACTALAESDCKPAAPLPQSKCNKDAQCCTGLVCGPAGSSQNNATTQCQPGCRIDGVFYASGAVNATQCQSCQPAVSTKAWSDLGNGTSCNDHNACTQTDTCQAGACVGSKPIVCTASDQCHTAGTCNPSTGVCSNPDKTNGTTCNDGNACTQTDTCQSGTCAGSNPVVCTASDQCHVAGTCNSSTGVCSNPNKTDGTACNDNNACTSNDVCTGGSCAGTAVTCTASDQCHAAGTCNPQTGCSNPPLANGTACNDGNACTSNDVCTGGSCAGAAVTCTASDQCHGAGTCNPQTGCSNPPLANGTACNDNNACTSNDVCTGGSCAGTAVTCTASDQCHTAGTCDPSTGACSNPVAASGTTCVNANDCVSGTATCNGSGQCIGGTNVANGTSCNGGNLCLTGGKCSTGTCSGGTPTICSGQDACHTAATCNPADGTCAAATPIADGQTCNSVACQVGGTCTAGACSGDKAAAGGKKVLCRPAAVGADGTTCDVPEYCDGTNVICPADGYVPAGTLCRAIGTNPSFSTYNLCDQAEYCTGTSNACPADTGLALGVACGGVGCTSTGFCQGRCGGVNGIGTIACSSDNDCMGQPATRTQCLPSTFDHGLLKCSGGFSEPNGHTCTDSNSDAGTCADGLCKTSFCSYDIMCPDGYVCDSNHGCVLATAGGLGVSCTGDPTGATVSGTCGFDPEIGTKDDCCAGMQGTGQGAAAGPNVSGRCEQCCNSSTSVSSVVSCGTDDVTQCCNGRCADTAHDIDNCGGCAYTPPSLGGGTNCNELLSACSPSATCNPDNGGCILSDACGSTTDGGPNICQIPTVTVTNSACSECYATSLTEVAALGVTFGRNCSTDADCQGVAGACRFFTSFCDANSVSPGLGCSSSTGCRNATFSQGACNVNFTCLTTLGVTTSIAPECTTSPYTSCGLICATGTLSQGNIGTQCSVDSDCTSGPDGYPGERCELTSCPISPGAALATSGGPVAAQCLINATYTCQIPLGGDQFQQ